MQNPFKNSLMAFINLDTNLNILTEHVQNSRCYIQRCLTVETKIRQSTSGS